MEISQLIVTLKTAIFSTVITFFLGIFLAYRVTKMKKFKNLVDAKIILPMVLPPTVVGFFLILIFGKKSLIGQFFLQFDINFVFTWKAAIISAVIVSLPLMYRTTRGAFESLDKNIIFAAQTLGASNKKIFLKIILSNARFGILAGIILSFTRALGEFGATIMFAGNIPGKTQTMSTAIYSAVQANDYESAFQWAILIIIFSLVFIIFLNKLNDLKKI